MLGMERASFTLEKNMIRALLILCTVLSSTVPAWSQASFKKVELRTTFGSAEQGNHGQLVVSARSVQFAKKSGAEYFSIPTDAVTEIFYSRVSGRRIGAAILVSPLLLLTKGRKHYLTLAFDDGSDLVGAVEFQLHKSNYRGTLRSIEQVTGLEMLYDQEGIKATKQTVASRRSNSSQAVVEISSDPEGAEVEIDGAFVGSTPRSRSLTPGKHTIKLHKKGYKDREYNVVVEAGETMDISAELESK